MKYYYFRFYIEYSLYLDIWVFFSEHIKMEFNPFDKANTAIILAMEHVEHELEGDFLCYLIFFKTHLPYMLTT